MANPILDRINEDPLNPEAPIGTLVLEATPQERANKQLSDIQESLATSSAQIAENITSLEEGAKTTAIATDIISGAISDVTAANQITTAARDNADLQAQNRTIEAFEAAGGTPIQAQLMQELSADAERVGDLRDERIDIANDEFTGIGLIDTVINELRSVQVNAEIGAAEGKLRSTANQISTVASATESFARVNALTKKTINEGTIEANYKKISAEGQIKASEAEITNLHSNAQSVSRVIGARAQQVSNLISVFRLEGEAEARQLQRERTAFAKEEMAFNRERWKVQLPAAEVALQQAQLNLEQSTALDPSKRVAVEAQYATAVKNYNDLLATEDQLVEDVQRAQSTVGTIIEPKETIIWGLRQSGITGARYQRLQEMGSSPRPVIGLTPYEASTNLAIASPSGNITQTAGTDLLQQVATLQAAKYARPESGGAPKDEETLEADFNKTAEELTTILSTDIKPGDNSNPYQAPPMTVLETMTAVQDSSLYKKVLQPMELKETDPNTIISAAVNAVTAKTLTPEQAAEGITTLFESAAAYNNTIQGGVERVGFPAQTTYNVSLAAPSAPLTDFLSSTTARIAVPSLQAAARVAVGTDTLRLRTFTIDLMDITQVQEAVVKYLAIAKPVEVATQTKTNEDTTEIIPAQLDTP